MSSNIIVLADGSFNEEAGRAGMGWVVVVKRKVSQYKAKKETGFIRNGSTYAEFKAAALGVKEVNEDLPTLPVTLVVDNEEVFLFTQKSHKDRDSYISILDESLFKKSVIELNEILKKFPPDKILIVSPKRLKNGPLKMIANMAHNAACLASGAGSTKETDFTKAARSKTGQPIPDNVKTSTPGANDVIDFANDDGPDLSEGPLPTFD